MRVVVVPGRALTGGQDHGRVRRGRKSGADIGILPFTGDVYQWWGPTRPRVPEPEGGTTWRRAAVPWTGSQSPSTSTHVGIVERVDGGQVVLIEGNSADQLRRVTHPLSGSVFYGGVHPR